MFQLVGMRFHATLLVCLLVPLSGCMDEGAMPDGEVTDAGGATQETESPQTGQSPEAQPPTDPGGLPAEPTGPEPAVQPELNPNMAYQVIEGTYTGDTRIVFTVTDASMTIIHNETVLELDNSTGTLVVPNAAPGPHEVVVRVSHDTNETELRIPYDVWGERPAWFDEEPTDDHTLRPGTRTSGCTSNFLYHYKHYRYFLGSAAHCNDGTNPMDGEPSDYCGNALPDKLGTLAWIQGIGEDFTLDENKGTLAFHGWASITPVRDQYPEAWCSAFDFALIEIPAHAYHKMHPKGFGIIGDVTGVADCSQWGGSFASPQMREVKAYGRSTFRGGMVPQLDDPDDVRNDKQGWYLYPAYEGMKCTYWFATPGIFGDSGGPASTMDGKAIGVAATINTLLVPSANDYTNIALSLQTMQDIEGWAPSILGTVPLPTDAPPG